VFEYCTQTFFIISLLFLWGGLRRGDLGKGPVAVDDVVEDGENVALNEVVVDEIDEPVTVVALFEKETRGAALLHKVDPPSSPQVEALVLKQQNKGLRTTKKARKKGTYEPVILKDVRVDDGGLHNLFAGKHSPSKSSNATANHVKTSDNKTKQHMPSNSSNFQRENNKRGTRINTA
jgi:hypothetical protein